MAVRAVLQRLVKCVIATCASATDAPSRRFHLPPTVHAVVHKPSARTIIIGDIHGCLHELDRLLADLAHDATTDCVVLVGDLVNKGPHSAAVVHAARTRGFLAVRGNHDDRAIFAWEERERKRLTGMGTSSDDAKYAYVDDFSQADVDYLRGLPYTLLLEAEGVLVVHAGIVPGVPLESQHPMHLYTMRNIIPQGGEAYNRRTAEATSRAGDDLMPKKIAACESSRLVAIPFLHMDGWSSTSDVGVAWASKWRPDESSLPGVRHVVFGHDAKRGLQQHEFATGLDTGCCAWQIASPSRMLLPAAEMCTVLSF